MAAPRRPRVLVCPVPHWYVSVLALLADRFEFVTYGKRIAYRSEAHAWADVVLAVKNAKSAAAAVACRPERPVIYVPIDGLTKRNRLTVHWAALAKCHAVLTQNDVLHRALRRACDARLGRLEHPIRHYAIGPRAYQAAPRVLWVGLAYIDLLTGWLQAQRPSWPLLALPGGCDLDRVPVELTRWPSAMFARWPRGGHAAEAAACGAAVDFKDDTLWHQTKPHTKIAEYIVSGLPVALNASHPAREFLLRFGLDAPVPEDTGRWFSRGYWEQTQQARPRVMAACSDAAIAAELAGVLDCAVAKFGRQGVGTWTAP